MKRDLVSLSRVLDAGVVIFLSVMIFLTVMIFLNVMIFVSVSYYVMTFVIEPYSRLDFEIGCRG